MREHEQLLVRFLEIIAANSISVAQIRRCPEDQHAYRIYADFHEDIRKKDGTNSSRCPGWVVYVEDHQATGVQNMTLRVMRPTNVEAVYDNITRFLPVYISVWTLVDTLKESLLRDPHIENAGEFIC